MRARVAALLSLVAGRGATPGGWISQGACTFCRAPLPWAAPCMAALLPPGAAAAAASRRWCWNLTPLLRGTLQLPPPPGAGTTRTASPSCARASATRRAAAASRAGSDPRCALECWEAGGQAGAAVHPAAQPHLGKAHGLRPRWQAWCFRRPLPTEPIAWFLPLLLIPPTFTPGHFSRTRRICSSTSHPPATPALATACAASMVRACAAGALRPLRFTRVLALLSSCALPAARCGLTIAAVHCCVRPAACACSRSAIPAPRLSPTRQQPTAALRRRVRRSVPAAGQAGGEGARGAGRPQGQAPARALPPLWCAEGGHGASRGCPAVRLPGHSGSLPLHGGQQAACGRAAGAGRHVRRANIATALAHLPLPARPRCPAMGPAPPPTHAGLSDADWPSVAAFYAHWSGFSSVKDFAWADQYHTGQAPNRKVGGAGGAGCGRLVGSACAVSVMAPRLQRLHGQVCGLHERPAGLLGSACRNSEPQWWQPRWRMRMLAQPGLSAAQVRRAMEAENEKARRAAKREYNETVSASAPSACFFCLVVGRAGRRCGGRPRHARRHPLCQPAVPGASRADRLRSGCR